MTKKRAKLDRSKFLKELKSVFPEIREPINQCHGLLHIEMGEFRRLTQQFIDSGNEQAVAKCFSLANKFLVDGRSNLRNAITVSYLEDLEFEDGKVRRAWSKELLTPALVKELADLEAYLDQLFRAPP